MTVGDWDRRQLCPDGACVGVIGNDGLCKVCGRAAQGWGDERQRGLDADAEDDALDEHEDYDDEDDEDEPEDDEDQDNDVYDNDNPISPGAPALLGPLAEWNDRRLCLDGACIGLLADDGHCKVCGKAGSKAKPASTSAARTDDAALAAAASDLAATATPGEVDSLAPAVELASPAADSDDEPRALCPDGGCVGVIGANGRCKVCGKEAA